MVMVTVRFVVRVIRKAAGTFKTQGAGCAEVPTWKMWEKVRGVTL